MLLRGEHNAWIHSAAAVTAVTLGLWLGLSALEWVAVAMCIGAVLAAEAFNSAIEALSDRVSRATTRLCAAPRTLLPGACC